MTFAIAPVPPEKPLTWTIRADGENIYPRHLEISSEYGVFVFGWRPENFNGWAFKPGKGGATTVTWSRTPAGEILIGLVHESRPNMGPEKVWCLLGGFVEVDESPEEAQCRESQEEGGINTSGARLLPGLPVNSDRMYFVQNPHEGEGMPTFALECPIKDLVQISETRWRPRAHLIHHAKESDLYFMPWKESVLLSADALTLAGIVRLMRILL